MGCNCKNKRGESLKEFNNELKKQNDEFDVTNDFSLSKILMKVIVFIAKVVAFILISVIAIVIVPFLMMFVIGRELFFDSTGGMTLNFTLLIKKLSKSKFFKGKYSEEDDEYEDDEEFEEAELEEIKFPKLKK